MPVRHKYGTTKRGPAVLKPAVFTHQSLADQVLDALKDEIISGRLKPNDRIDLNDYTTKWSISPTPLRDALKQLETTGLVVIHPRRGVFVADLDRAGLAETFELRVALEGMAIRLATRNVPAEVAATTLRRYRDTEKANGNARLNQLQKVDDLIHEIGLTYCNNKRLLRMMESVSDLVLWSKQTIIRNVPEPYEATLPEHLAICEAVVAGDGDAAERAMRTHLENSFARIESYLDDHPQ
jgi:DNA-binding GntR family transcriptional regulator